MRIQTIHIPHLMMVAVGNGLSGSLMVNPSGNGPKNLGNFLFLWGLNTGPFP